MTRSIPWFASPPDAAHDEVAEWLIDLWIREPGLGDSVAQIPWLADDVDDDELWALLGLTEISSLDLGLAKTVVASPWFPDGINPHEGNVIHGLSIIAFLGIGQAKTVAALPWLTDDITEHEGLAILRLGSIASQNHDLAQTVADLSWFADDVNLDEVSALGRLDSFASLDLDAAKTVAALPWFDDGINPVEVTTLRRLRYLASKVDRFATYVVGLPWFADKNPIQLQVVIESLSRLAHEDAELVMFVAGLPWFADSLEIQERGILGTLDLLASVDAQLAAAIVGMPWFGDDITIDEWGALVELAELAHEDARAAASIVESPWFAEGDAFQRVVLLKQVRYGTAEQTTFFPVDKSADALVWSFPWVDAEDSSWYQSPGTGTILQLLQEFPAVAEEVLGYPWVHDDLTRTERRALSTILFLARKDLELAWHALESPFMDPPFLQRDAYALQALNSFSSHGPPPGIVQSGPDADIGSGMSVGLDEGSSDLLAELAGQSWFSDGLDDDEAALLHGIAYAQGDFLQALIETNFVASTFVDLPWTGKMGLAVVSHTPFPPDDQTLQTLEEGVRIIEDFMGAPFPVGDVTLLLVEPEFWTSEARAQLFRFAQGGGPSDPAYVRAIVGAVNPQTGPPIRTLYHELGHHFLLSAPRWLHEGLANFLEAYTVARTGGEGLAERLAHLERSERCAENIWDHVNPYTVGRCDYELGEKFLLGMYAALGHDAVSVALRELYTRTLIFENLNHDNIYYAFQSNVPPGKEEAFQTAWFRYHGSPVIDCVHADSPDLQPLVALYHATDGEHWVNNTNWLSDAPLGAWYGVYTNPQGEVTGLDLDGNGLVGEIPSELGRLNNLIGLSLAENSLTGEIPPELGELIHLDQLQLQWNQLTGKIPAELGNLTNLRSMDLFRNHLTGEIPPELAQLTKLEPILLTGNQFSGCIAAELPEMWVEATGLMHCEESVDP